MRAPGVAARELRSVMTTYALRIQGMADGSETEAAHDLLVNLAWQIGLGAEIAAAIEPGSVRAKRLHGALRTVVDLCLAGYVWRAAFADALDQAATESAQLTADHPRIWPQRRAGPDLLAAAVQQRRVTADMVAGAELYRDTEKA